MLNVSNTYTFSEFFACYPLFNRHHWGRIQPRSNYWYKYSYKQKSRRALTRLRKLEQRGLDKLAQSSILGQEELTPEFRDGGSDAPFTRLPRFSAKCGPYRVM